MGKLESWKFYFPFLIIICSVLRIGDAQSASFLVNCGSNSRVDVDGRKWIGDLAPDSNLTLSSTGITASTAKLGRDSTLESLYKTSRIFTSNLNYTLKGINGNHFVRLHFCPFPFEDYNANDSSFSVAANGLRLLMEFNAPGEILHKSTLVDSAQRNSTLFYIIKEFVLDISSDELVLVFTPTKGRFGFINAIEIAPIPADVFSGLVTRVGGNSLNLNFSGRGLETMYRLNIGGPEIKPREDLNLWRSWEVDTSYMINADAGSEISNSSEITYGSSNDSMVAPILVYESARTMSDTGDLEKRFNMSWKFEVDPNFDYMIRLHFCELLYDKLKQRVFRIFINNKTAADNFDVVVRAGGMNKAYHEDFLDPVSLKISTLWIQLGPDTGAGAGGTDALLNGLEIFKLSRNENLAYVETYDSVEDSSKNSRGRVLWVGIGAGLAFIAFLAVVIALVVCIWRSQRTKPSDTKKNARRWPSLSLHGTIFSSAAHARGSHGSLKPTGSIMASNRSGQRFTLAEIRAATSSFDESLVIGVGGFGKVYKGEIEDNTLVAIKRANPQSEQGVAEFETEIEMLSKLRHRHLVSLIGFCDEQNEMVLVYEYMANGTLRSHLFGSNLPPLSWKQRLEACIGAARGLHYLHTGAEQGIIHRDVKTTNILLDNKFVAKVADFGLSKNSPAWDHTHISTAVKGSFGYLDPEYFRRQQLTDKSDIYSFGVVLMEVVCARAVINPTLPKDEINLAEWAMRWQRQRSLSTIIDKRLEGKYCPDSLRTYGEIAEKCLADEGRNRPTMGEVLWHLEYVLQLQEAWLRSDGGENSGAPRSEREDGNGDDDGEDEPTNVSSRIDRLSERGCEQGR